MLAKGLYTPMCSCHIMPPHDWLGVTDCVESGIWAPLSRNKAYLWLLNSPVTNMAIFKNGKQFLAATKQLYEWYCLSVRLSVRPSVTPF